MQLLIKNRPVALWNDLNVMLVYNSVASSFSFSYLFEPWDGLHRELFMPSSFFEAKVKHGNETLITGLLLHSSSKKENVKRMRTISGYSRSGVIQECCVKEGLQFDGMGLREIAETICRPFNINVVVDDVVKGDCDKVYNAATIEADGRIREFLSKLACQRNVVLSHNNKGELLLTRADTHKTPIGHFEEGDGKTLSIGLEFNGQGMHSEIIVKSQGGGSNAGESSIRNPYVKGPVRVVAPSVRPYAVGVFDPNYRPCVEVQSAGDDNDTPKTARYYLGQELREIQIPIVLYGWEVGGNLVRPGDMLTMKSPENSIYQKTRLFIERVRYYLDKESLAELCELSCVVPEVYNDDAVVNIFTGSNMTVPAPADETGAHAVITPFV